MLLGAQPETGLEFILEFGPWKGEVISSSSTTIRGCGVHQVGPNRLSPWAVFADVPYHVPRTRTRWIVVDILRAPRAT